MINIADQKLYPKVIRIEDTTSRIYNVASIPKKKKKIKGKGKI